MIASVFRSTTWLLLLLAALSSAAQGKPPIQPRSDFTDLNVHDAKPLYQVSVTSEAFAFQVRVNDLPVFTSTGKAKGKITFFINQAILESGKQSLSVHLAPAADSAVLAGSAGFKVVLVETGWLKGGGMVEPRTIIDHELPKQPSGATKPSDHTFAFEAKVPYNLNAWQNSTALSPNDARLRAEVVAAYESLIQVFARKDGVAFMSTLARAEWSAFQANYVSPEEAKRKHDGWVVFVNAGNKKMAALENYEMEVRGSGKLVRLKRIGAAKAGEGVLRIPYAQNGRERTLIYDVYFHRPTPSAKLEAIWYSMVDAN